MANTLMDQMIFGNYQMEVSILPTHIIIDIIGKRATPKYKILVVYIMSHPKAKLL